MWESFITATTVEHGQDARVINGGTALILEIDRRTRSPKVVIDVSRISGLDSIRLEDSVFRLGAGVTHNQAAANNEVVAKAFPLASACWHVGSPQIRNRATLSGNLVTASPTVTRSVSYGSNKRAAQANVLKGVLTINEPLESINRFGRGGHRRCPGDSGSLAGDSP